MTRRLATLALVLSVWLALASSLAAQERAVRRSRLLVAHPERLTGSTQVGGALRLHLFDDASFSAVLDSWRADPYNGFVWSGHLAGVENSKVVLVVDGGVMAGEVSTPQTSYRVRYAGAGLHLIEELEAGGWADYRDDTEPADGNLELPVAEAELKLRQPTSSMTTLDLLVLYTRSAERWAGGPEGIRSLILSHAAVANTALANSRAKVRFRVVKTKRVTYQGSDSLFRDLGRLRLRGDGFLDGIHGLRKRVGADFVSLYRAEDLNDRPCGVAVQGWNRLTEPSELPESPFSVIHAPCRAKTLAHELGHNMGLLHAREDYADPERMESIGAFRYSFGYKSREPGNRFYTVMAYPCGSCSRILYFSNPKVRYRGSRTGVRRRAPGAAHTVHSINRIRGELEAYRSCKVDCQGG